MADECPKRRDIEGKLVYTIVLKKTISECFPILLPFLPQTL
jgi:hypothetical protein